jgi:hypothetical protein
MESILLNYFRSRRVSIIPNRISLNCSANVNNTPTGAHNDHSNITSLLDCTVSLNFEIRAKFYRYQLGDDADWCLSPQMSVYACDVALTWLTFLVT